MSKVRAKYVPASVNVAAFNCPHCGALTTQHWYNVYLDALGENRIPFRVTEETYKKLDELKEDDARDRIRAMLDQLSTGLPLTHREDSDTWIRLSLKNVNVSRCYSCDAVAVWIDDRLLWPAVGTAPAANPDMPPEIRVDYDEASTILDLSPRGAAALLRLAIQKLCKHLGQPGKSINDDIGALVKAGLDPRIQKALDIVRVVGNNAVHPGQIDLRDDRGTAETLFGLVNLITEKTISEPKHVDELYATLPPSSRKAIEDRDS